MLYPNEGLRMLTYQEMMVSHGAYGKEFLKAGESSTAGQYFRYLIPIDDTECSAIIDEGLPAADQTKFQGEKLYRGIPIPGKFTGITVTSGRLICINDVPER
jgi:hypothetical protein